MLGRWSDWRADWEVRIDRGDPGADGGQVVLMTNSTAADLRIAAFIAATAGSVDLDAEVHELNGQPALVFYHENEPFAALLLAIANDRIHRVFFHRTWSACGISVRVPFASRAMTAWRSDQEAGPRAG
jgi:hypothetical protein